MKNSILLFLLAVFTATSASSQVYIDASFDPNALFRVFDNEKMIDEQMGFDWDLEVGAMAGRFSAFAYYGRFEEIKYQNYGAGADFHIVDNRNINWTIGSSVGVIARRYMTGVEWDRPAWFTWMQWNARTTGTLWFTDNIGLSARIQYQNRPDIPKIHGIVEGSVGIKYKFVK